MEQTNTKTVKDKGLLKTNNIDEMLNKSPLRLLIKLGIPAILMALVDELNSFIDAIFMGQYFGSEAVSSMSIILPVMLLMVAIAMLLSEGTATAASRHLGAKEVGKASVYFMNTIIITIASGLVIGVAFFFFVPNILNLFTITDNVRYFANIYLKIIGLGMPVFLTVLVLSRMVYIEGRNKFLLLTTLLQFALNAAINFLLIGVFKIGIMGAAIGTVASQLIQIALLLRYINSSKMEMKLRISNLHINKEYLKQVFSLGMPTFVTMVLLSLTLGVESRIISGFGSDPLSVQTITGYLFSISSSIASGLMGVSLVIMSYSVGAKNMKRFFKVLKTSAVVVFIMVTLINIGIVINSDIAVRIFTNSKGVLELIGIPAIVYGVSAPFIFTTNVVLYAMQPVGMEKTSTWLFAFQQMILFLPLLFILKDFGFVYAISAQPVAEVIGGIITLALVPWFIIKTKKYFKEQEKI